MSRLTERGWKSKCEGYPWNVHPVKDIDDLQYYKKLAEYEDAEEQGLLLRLPCKTGDTVYYRTNNNDINPIKINEINISNSDVIYNGYFMKCTYEFDNSDFGKTVFLTKSEAEVKLVEMEGAK